MEFIKFSVRSCLLHAYNREILSDLEQSSMTTLTGGFLVTNYHDSGSKVSKSSLDRGRKQKRPLRQTAVDALRG